MNDIARQIVVQIYLDNIYRSFKILVLFSFFSVLLVFGIIEPHYQLVDMAIIGEGVYVKNGFSKLERTLSVSFRTSNILLKPVENTHWTFYTIFIPWALEVYLALVSYLLSQRVSQTNFRSIYSSCPDVE